jgi:hypothetical protein
LGFFLLDSSFFLEISSIFESFIGAFESSGKLGFSPKFEENYLRSYFGDFLRGSEKSSF